MADLKRVDSHHGSDGADRESRAEALLVEGLDRYLGGQYEEAIHIWTRVLFLDRSHARARAYIDRARTALAERQRRAEEMLSATGEMLAQGQTSQARNLLDQAVAQSGDDERAAALRSQLERLERASAPAEGRPAVAVVDARPVGVRGRYRWAVALTVLAAGLAVAFWLRPAAAPSGALVPVAAGSPRPVLSSSEVALVRARTLYAQGRLAEALAALDRVAPDSPGRDRATDLRIEIQHLLLASGRSAPAVGARSEAGRR